MTVDFSPQVDKILTKLSQAEGKSKTEILRRALGLYSYFEKTETRRFGRFVAIVDADDKILKKIKWV
ncbi:MAG: ribbon-helix-helix protein, CopG family [bacterium]